MLWHWLAEKKGEYYRLCETAVGQDDEQQKEKLQLYLRLLGVRHADTWLAASGMDWAIADARKRIAQHKAQHDSGVVWLPPASSADHTSAPTHAIKKLKSQLKAANEMIARADEAIEITIKQLEHSKTDQLDQQTIQRLLAAPNWRDIVRQLGEENRQQLLKDKEVLEMLLHDAEARAQRLRKVSKSATQDQMPK